VIGYYVHHQGHGHLAMARCIAARLGDRVTGLSSLPGPPDWPGDWLRLARDDNGEPAVEPTARGQLHWAPLGHAGLRNRMAAAASWIQRAAPSVMVVDVSVEVAALARLLGVPVVSVVLPGRREDPAHRLGHALAQTLIAPWPAFLSADLLSPDLRSGDGLDAGLPSADLRGQGPVAAPVQAVGAFSRFDGRTPEPAVAGRGLSVLVLQGGGGTEITPRQLREAAAATPGWEWTVLGGASGSWVADPWPLLGQADVVVTHGGLNAVAEVAAARKPAVVVPQTRPHGEQHATGRALARAGLAVVPDQWPQATSWPAVLRRALELGGGRWSAWSPGTGAGAAARIIESVGAGPREGGEPCAVRS
jgi:Glycosyltransferase family 28 C-terminal domain